MFTYIFTNSDVILFSILPMQTVIEGLTGFSSCFFYIYLKWSWICDIEYAPSGNSKSSFYVGADILNLLFLYDFL